MRRRQNKKLVHITLLPFLSILACLIGSLSLVITGISFGQMVEKQDPEDVKRYEEQNREYELTRSENSKLKKELERVRKRMQAIQDENKELASSTSQLNNLKTQLEEVEKKTENSTERLVRLGDQISDHKNKIDLLKKDIEEAGTQINLNQAEIAFRKDPANYPVTVVQKSETGSITVPFFLECAGDQLNYIEKNKVVKTFREPLISNKEYHDFLSRVKSVSKGGVVFLVRSNGQKIYKDAKELAIHFSCKNGKIPVQGIGNIDTSNYASVLPATSPIPVLAPSTPGKNSPEVYSPSKKPKSLGELIQERKKAEEQKKKEEEEAGKQKEKTTGKPDDVEEKPTEK